MAESASQWEDVGSSRGYCCVDGPSQGARLLLRSPGEVPRWFAVRSAGSWFVRRSRTWGEVRRSPWGRRVATWLLLRWFPESVREAIASRAGVALWTLSRSGERVGDRFVLWLCFACVFCSVCQSCYSGTGQPLPPLALSSRAVLGFQFVVAFCAMASSAPHRSSGKGSGSGYGKGGGYEEDKKCLKCNEYGHVQKYCPQMYCTSCKSLGHSFTVCAETMCFRCFEKGHAQKACPNGPAYQTWSSMGGGKGKSSASGEASWSGTAWRSGSSAGWSAGSTWGGAKKGSSAAARRWGSDARDVRGGRGKEEESYSKEYQDRLDACQTDEEYAEMLVTIEHEMIEKEEERVREFKRRMEKERPKVDVTPPWSRPDIWGRTQAEAAGGGGVMTFGTGKGIRSAIAT